MIDPDRDSKISWTELESCLSQNVEEDGARELLADELEKKQIAGVDVEEEELKTNYMEMLHLNEKDPEEVEERRDIQRSSAVFQEIKAAIEQNKTLFGRQLRSGKDLFESMDQDGDGHLTYEEFTNGLKQMNLGLSDEQIKEVINQLDVDKDGEIEFEELFEVLQIDEDDFNPVKQTEKRILEVKKKVQEQEKAITHLCGSFAFNKSARVIASHIEKRKKLEIRMTRQRARIRRKFENRRSQRRSKWSQVLSRSPYGVDQHAEHKIIMNANKERNRLEARLKKRREKKRLKCLGKLIVETLTNADQLGEVRRESRELALEESRLKAMVDLEKARRRGMNSKYYREKLSRQEIRARIQSKEAQNNADSPEMLLKNINFNPSEEKLSDENPITFIERSNEE